MGIDDWQEVTLGDYVNVKHGFAFKGVDFSETPTNDILVTPGNFSTLGGFKVGKEKYYKGSVPEAYILKKDNVIITMTDLSKNGDTLGYSALVPEHDNKRYLHNQRIGLVQFLNDKIDYKFLYWRLRNRDYQRYIVGCSNGTTVKHTSPDVIKKFKFNLPPLKEQKAIASILSSIDDKIELNNNINKNLEEMAQAIFKNWFVDFEPFKDCEFVESELGLIPSNFHIGQISDIAKIVNGKRPPVKSDIRTNEFNLPIIGASSIMGYTNDFLYDEKILVTGRVGTHGIIQRLNCKCWTSDNTLILKSDYYEFLYQILKNVDFKSMNRGSTQPLITQSDLKNIKIIIPEKQSLEDFESRISKIMLGIEKNQIQNNELIELRNTLLPKLMSGEIRVPLKED